MSDADKTNPTRGAGNPDTLLERILECAAEGIYGLDREGRVTFVNPAAERMTSRPRSEQLGRRQHELLHHTRADGSAFPAEECPIHATLCDGISRTIDRDCFWRRDGTSFPVTYTCAPLSDASGNPAGAVVTFTHLTERPDERRYRSLVTATSAFVWRNTPDGRLTYISDAWLDLVGLTLEQAAGWSWIAVVHPEDRDEYERCWRSACESETVFDFEYRLCCRDGAVRWFLDHAVPVRDDQGRLLEWMGTGLDVTARRQAEEEVKRQRAQYRTLVESTSAIFWAADPHDFRFTYVSPEAETLLGYPARRWTEESGFWADHIHPDDREWATSYCARATAELRQHTFDHRMIAADGRTVWLRDVVNVLVEDGKAVELVGVMIDNTTTKENERALEYTSGLQRTLVEASQQFIAATPTRRDRAIRDVLQSVGSYCAVDRSYLFRYSEDLRFASNTHEWCAPGIESMIDHLQEVPSDIFPNLSAAMKRHEVVAISDVALLGDAWSMEKENLQQQNVQSLVLAPIVTGDSLYGFIGFDSVRRQRNWGDEEVRLLRVLGDLIGTAIQRDKAQEALRESESLRSHAESLAHLGSWEWDIANDRFVPSAEWRRVTGVHHDPLSRGDVLALSHPDDLPAIRENLEQTMGTGVPYELEHRIIRRDNGETRWIKVHAELFNSDGSPQKLLGFIQDITERKLAEAAVAESEARYRSVVENISEVVYRTDDSGFYTFLNPAWEDITGFTINETLGTHFLDYVHPDDVEFSRIEHQRLSEGDQSDSRFEVRYITRQQGTRWIETRSRVVADAEGRFAGCIGTLRDVTEQREAEQRITYLAEYDPLTDLPNRMLALDRLGQLINALPRSGGFIGVLYLDLDQFKRVNDTLGHEVGDQVLVETARRLRRTVRRQDTVARLGGDEFLILLSGLRSPTAVQPIVESLLRCFRDPFNAAGREITLTASIGSAVAPDDGQSSTALLRNADMAMYQSKSAGRNTHHYFTEAMNRDVARRMAIEEQLRGALQRDELGVVYQPVIDLVENSVVGGEALLRWHSPELGDIAVDEFIPIAEQTGLIHDIGEYVLNQALQKAAIWRQSYRPDFRISVNVSPQQFRDRALIGRIKDSLKRASLPGEALEVEITEGVLLSGQAQSKETLHVLRDAGVRIAMDDFGTGYASLSYLREYSFDTLKIDRSFVGDMTNDINDRELVVTSLRLASGLNLTAIAEGVETDAQLQLLREHGCRLAQGYLLSRPVDAQTFTELLSRWPVRNEHP